MLVEVCRITKGHPRLFAGAIFLADGSRLNLSDSEVQKNQAQDLNDLHHSEGGGVGVIALSLLSVHKTLFSSNSASGDSSDGLSRGGALAVWQGSIQLGRAVVFANNIARSNATSAYSLQEACTGGAISMRGALSELVARDGPMFNGNSVEGNGPLGGALYLSDGTTVLHGAIFDRNAARASTRVSMGGAIYVRSGFARLQGCTITRNVASLTSNMAQDASAGGIAIGKDAQVVIADSDFFTNSVDGQLLATSTALSETGMHIHCAGKLALEQCRFEHFLRDTNPRNCGTFWLMFVDSAARLAISSTSATSSCLIGFLGVRQGESEVVIRNSEFYNMTISKLVAQLGIVNCSFKPPLDASVKTVLPPNCSVKLAGQPPLCDRQSKCTARATGGVDCSCALAGLSTPPGVEDNGFQCLAAPPQSMLPSLRSLAPSSPTAVAGSAATTVRTTAGATTAVAGATVTTAVPSSTSAAAGATTATAILKLTMAGALSDFDATKLGSIKSDLATAVQISPSAISLSVAAGSVMVLATMPAAAAADAVAKFSAGTLTTLGAQQVRKEVVACIPLAVTCGISAFNFCELPGRIFVSCAGFGGQPYVQSCQFLLVLLAEFPSENSECITQPTRNATPKPVAECIVESNAGAGAGDCFRKRIIGPAEHGAAIVASIALKPTRKKHRYCSSETA